MNEADLTQPPAAAKYIGEACQRDPELRQAIALMCGQVGAEDLYDLAGKMPEMIVELAQTQWMAEQQDEGPRAPTRA